MVDPAPPVPPREGLRAQLDRAWARLRGGQLTPGRAAASVALGLFVGVLPVPGLHLLIVLGVALPLRLDVAVAYAAANISIPPLAPFLWLAGLECGSLALRGSTVPMTAAGARALVRHGPGPLLAALALGSVLFGAALALLGALIAYVLVGSFQRRPPRDEAVERTAERYARASRSRGTYWYVRGKLTGDPSARAVAQRAPLGEVLDLGCGRGQLAVLLLEAGAATSVRGLDWDARKVALANDAADGLAATFAVGDVRACEGPADADTVLLIDVLHYFDRATQDALLARAASRVRPGGTLLVRDADVGRGWRSVVTRVQEGVGTFVRFNRGERVLFRDVARELVPALEAQGFACEVAPCWGNTPFANVLLVARRAP